MSFLATDRNRNMVSGAIGLLLLVAATSIGIKASFGAFDDVYPIQGSFVAAGQGLISGSDVKIRGIDVGEVRRIELVDSRALVTMEIDRGVEIPVTASAVIRPKTLFGEKFVDIEPGDDELAGPFLAGSDPRSGCVGQHPCILETRGGFELEQVLADAYPILDAIDPTELGVVLDELANASDGLGPTVNRSIVNAAILTELSASNDAEFRQFTSDLALLSEELDRLTPGLLDMARDLNVALPSLNDRADRLNTALVQLARLSGDVADLLENNTEFTENALTNGSKAIQVLFDERDQIQPLLQGIEQYTSTLAEAVRIQVGDGTMMAAIKMVVNPGYLVEHTLADAGAANAGATGTPAPTTTPTTPSTTAPDTPVDEAAGAIEQLLEALLGGGR